MISDPFERKMLCQGSNSHDKAVLINPSSSLGLHNMSPSPVQIPSNSSLSVLSPLYLLFSINLNPQPFSTALLTLSSLPPPHFLPFSPSTESPGHLSKTPVHSYHSVVQIFQRLYCLYNKQDPHISLTPFPASCLTHSACSLPNLLSQTAYVFSHT